jgi:hypothetical protein
MEKIFEQKETKATEELRSAALNLFLSFFGKRVENEGGGTSFVLFVTFCLNSYIQGIRTGRSKNFPKGQVLRYLKITRIVASGGA